MELNNVTKCVKITTDPTSIVSSVVSPVTTTPVMIMTNSPVSAKGVSVTCDV